MSEEEKQPIPEETKNEIREYQKLKRLAKIDGIVGKETWNAIKDDAAYRDAQIEHLKTKLGEMTTKRNDVRRRLDACQRSKSPNGGYIRLVVGALIGVVGGFSIGLLF